MRGVADAWTRVALRIKSIEFRSIPPERRPSHFPVSLTWARPQSEIGTKSDTNNPSRIHLRQWERGLTLHNVRRITSSVTEEVIPTRGIVPDTLNAPRVSIREARYRLSHRTSRALKTGSPICEPTRRELYPLIGPCMCIF